MRFLIVFIFFVLSACSQRNITPLTDLKVLNEICLASLNTDHFIYEKLDKTLHTVKLSTPQELSQFINKNEADISWIDYDFKLTDIELNSIQSNQSKSANQAFFKNDLSWALLRVNAPFMWDKGFFGQNVDVAIIDTGLEIENPFLSSHIAQTTDRGRDEDRNRFLNDTFGWDAIRNTGLFMDYQGHGTSVASLISSDPVNGKQISMAPEAQIIPIAYRDQNESTPVRRMLQSLRYAKIRNAKIINFSSDLEHCSSALKNELIATANSGILIVISAGNQGQDLEFFKIFPTSFEIPNILSVGATEFNDPNLPHPTIINRFSSSNYGTGVHLFAPGHEIPSLIASTDLRQTHIEGLSGTSLSAPLVAGAAALLWSAFPEAKAKDIFWALTHSGQINPSNQNQTSRPQSPFNDLEIKAPFLDLQQAFMNLDSIL